MAQKSTILLFLLTLIVFSGACSKRIPCPETGKPTKQAKVKKKKTPKANPDGGTDDYLMADGSIALTEDQENNTESKPQLTGTRNKYNKNGLLQKKKYKRLRSNPGRKRNRVNSGIFSNMFSGKKKPANKAKRSRPSVEPADE